MKPSVLDRIIYYFFPSWLLNTTPWKSIWQESEDNLTIRRYRILFLLLGIGYLLHYFFVDIPLGLTKDPVWLIYRFGIFSGCMASIGLTFLKDRTLFLSQLAYWLVAIGTSWAQAHSMVWYSGVSPIWGFFVAVSFAVFYRADNLLSILMLSILIAVQWPSIIDTNQNLNLIGGCLIVAYLFVIFSVKRRIEEIQNFIQVQKQIEIEKVLANVQQNLADQIRAFLPGKINRDLVSILRNGLSVTQAIDEVLRPKNKTIACLFSDIRGYTEASKRSDYILQSALPNIKATTAIVEENNGVPRLVGDLVFAYFEEDSHSDYLLNSFKTANVVLKENILHNDSQQNNSKVTRYIILDHGPAICGNLGGANSSREITALGEPVNRSARIDEVTKSRVLRGLFGTQAIIYSEQYVQALKNAGFTADFELVDLEKLNLKIRDFEEMKKIYYSIEVQDLKSLDDYYGVA